MEINWFNLIFSSILLGVGLAMDAFSVSLANGLTEQNMRPRKFFGIPAVFALFQAIMPLCGWLAVSSFLELFNKSMPFIPWIIPWISFFLLCFIGGKMLYRGIRSREEEKTVKKALTVGALLLQALATSIDALTAGVDFAKDYSINQYPYVLLAVLIIAAITFVICVGGIKLGQLMGTRLASKAEILGGCVLLFLGLKIFVSNIIFA